MLDVFREGGHDSNAARAEEDGGVGGVGEDDIGGPVVEAVAVC